MPSRALLLGAQQDGLKGVENDVAAMAKALESRGFLIDRCHGDDATRANILAAYEKLINDTGPNDPVVVFYSGHGGRAQPPNTGGSGPDLMDLQFIAPMDIHASTPEDFRGITSVELSALLNRLTDKTDNVVVMLDCCHAMRMSRDDRLRIKAVPPMEYDLLRAHVDRLRAAGQLDIDRLRTTGNPDAVRLVACAPDQSASEYAGADGHQIGMFTEAVTLVLEQAGTQPVTWATVMDRVRERVGDLSSGQRPEVEGPANRLLFETAVDELLTTLRVTPLPEGRVRLECAPLLDVREGDEFLVMPPGAVAADPATKIGDLRVDRVGPLSAEGPVVLAAGVTEVPVGGRAHRTRAAAPALAVRVPDSAADLARAVSTTPLIRLAGPDETPLAEVRVDPAGRLTVHDLIGPLHTPDPDDGAGIARVVNNLKVLAQASALRRLVGRSDWSLGADLHIEWGRVVDGQAEPLGRAGAVAYTGDKIYVSVRNDSADTVFVSLIDIGVAGRVQVLTNSTPTGVRLTPGKTFTYGFNDVRGVLTGLGLSWPAGLDPAQARPETLLIVAASVAQDMSALEQRGIGRGGRAVASPLEQMLAQIAVGGSRDLSSEFGSTVRYDVHAIDFELGPLPDEGPFLIDERADPPTRHRTARGTRPTTLAVRLEELIVHRNRAMFGADVRVDTVVLTGAGPTAQPTYRAHTERFANIADGEPLPLDRLLIFHGPVVDYLDIAIWVSRDSKGSLALNDMLTEELTGFEVQDALTQLGGALVVPSHAAAAAVLVGAGAVVVNVAYKLLRGAVGDVIGVYRGSLLAGEGYRTGRHPSSGSRRVQDFSIAYSVTGVGP
jgi:hypothetical protein